MSASVAAMVNPTSQNDTSMSVDSTSKASTRRRQVVVSEKKTNTEINMQGVPTGVTADRITTNGNDLSQTMRGDSVIERSRDLSTVKKGLITSTASPKRRRSSSRPEKPRWQTILSVMTKNAVLLIALFWLGQTIWRWADNSRKSADFPYAALDFDSRISEVETSLKKAAKMTQVQLEILDKRAKQAEERGHLFEKELRELAARTDDMDKFLSELHDKSFLSKREFELFMNELRERKSSEGKENDLNLEDVMRHAREVVMKEIEKHAADGLGRVDYALASAGGRVVSHSEPYKAGKGGSWLPVAKVQNKVHDLAHKMLEPSFGEPGQCFPLKGTDGFVDIRLRAGIIPEAVTLEHVAKSVAYDRSSAPKDCMVSGWLEGPEEDTSSRAKKMVLLNQFTYDLEKSNAQTFNIDATEPGVINMVRLDFSSNHGSSSHTCIYRLRVHGYDPASLMAMSA